MIDLCLIISLDKREFSSYWIDWFIKAYFNVYSHYIGLNWLFIFCK